MPLAQYVAFRLCGESVSEVTSLGAQTHLWNPAARKFSDIAVNHGWAEKFAPIANAWDQLGALNETKLSGCGIVHTGIHDSNANLLRFLSRENFCLLSTGTWIIGFDKATSIESLKPEFGQVSNNRVIALPSFTDSGDPVPRLGGMGKIVGKVPDVPGARVSLASVYCAQMTALALDKLGTSGTVIIDGPIRDNPVILTVLQLLNNQLELFQVNGEGGTSSGAALLALMEEVKLPNQQPY